MDFKDNSDNAKKIEVRHNGPYIVSGYIPLVSKTQVVSEYGEPMTWKIDGKLASEESYGLCRCGQSNYKPFCDNTHLRFNFDGTELAPTDSTNERQETYPGSKSIVIRIDQILCTGSGFCSNRMTSIAEMATHDDDTQVRTLAISMIEHCPSGALTYAIKEGEEDIEADLPQQIAVTTEITSEGPIQGPLWVTGGIPIIRSDGQPFESRNRVTLCNCGHSQIKPLCDGSHRDHPTKK
jgi:CDGSH-type Zn-finger protein/ferredoxin